MAYSYLTHEYSNFPSEVIKLHKYKDIDDTIKDVIDRYMTYYNEGDFASAVQVLKDSEIDLNDYMVTSRVINTIIEELRNAQIFALQQQQVIYVQDNEPSFPETADVWIGGADDV